MTWNVKTELINPETELRKVFATLTDATDIENKVVQRFFIKACMKTLDEKKAVWDNIWKQYLESKKVVSDAVGDEGKTNLEGRMP